MTHKSFIWAISLTFSILVAIINYQTSLHERSLIPRGNAPLYPSRRIYFLLLLMLLRRIVPASNAGNLLFSFQQFFSQMLLLSILLVLLLLLLPLLRKFLRAESCAFLWFTVFLSFTYGSGEYSLLVIDLPFSVPGPQTIKVLLIIWLSGAVAILLYSCISHLLFRHRLLASAKPVSEEILSIYRKKMQVANLTVGDISVRTSSMIKTPLSIGLFPRTTYLLLPERPYTEEELGLILHHEIVHISRGDSLCKFFLTCMLAFLWFNPLMWIAMRRCADDLELSCDEAVLYGRSPQVRKQYGLLLLQTAGVRRGFTSNLSASSDALRYRLKHVVAPGKRIVGSWLIGILCFLFLFVGMTTRLCFRAAPIDTLSFLRAEQVEIVQIYSFVDGKDYDGVCKDPSALLSYIAGLSLRATTEIPSLDVKPYMQISFHTPNGRHMVTFTDTYLRVINSIYSPVDGTEISRETSYYRLTEAPDWTFLISCVEKD